MEFRVKMISFYMVHVFECAFNFPSRRKPVPHFSQLYGFWPSECVHKCAFKLPLNLNDLPHTWQACFATSVCVEILWLRRLEWLRKPLSQTSHRYGRSSVCTANDWAELETSWELRLNALGSPLTCSVNADLLLNNFAQMLQVNGLTPPWISICCLRICRVQRSAPHTGHRHLGGMLLFLNGDFTTIISSRFVDIT